jgi:hypothetical protein
MTQHERVQQQQQQLPATTAAAAGNISKRSGANTASVSAPPEAAAAATAHAIAFKDRLVEYDRQSEKRTTVIDDQSDFFEIETNAWLSDEVGTV